MSAEVKQDVFKEGLFTLAAHYADLKPEFLLNCLKKFSTVREVLKTVYLILVSEKTISPIDDLELEEKEMLWEKVKGEKLNIEQKKDVCKAIYVIQKIKG